MGTSQFPRKTAAAAKEAADEFQEGAGSMQRKDQCWTRSLAVSSLITGALLLAKGKRKAGMAMSLAGGAIALIENPDEVVAVWKSIPAYLESGTQWLGRLEAFIDDLSRQGDRLRSLLEKSQPY